MNFVGAIASQDIRQNDERRAVDFPPPKCSFNPQLSRSRGSHPEEQIASVNGNSTTPRARWIRRLNNASCHRLHVRSFPDAVQPHASAATVFSATTTAMTRRSHRRVCSVQQHGNRNKMRRRGRNHSGQLISGAASAARDEY